MRKLIWSNLGLSIVATSALIGLYHFGFKHPATTKTIEIIKETPNLQFANHTNLSGVVSFVSAAENSVNSVVHIHTVTKKAGGYAYDPFRDFFYGNPYQKLPDQKISGSGSGVIISKNGYIVTNNHVIDQATEIEVTLNDKRSVKAILIGTDPTTDLAVIKIEASGLIPISYGNSDEVKVGEWVLAVGNPFNLTSTVTAGIVSAKGRNINILKEEYAIENFIQTDAAVNPGNSGGALVNIHGDLIGINTAIASNTGSYTGYAFAVPVNLVQKVVRDLVEFGIVQRGLLGVKIANLTQEHVVELKLGSLNGVYVAEVIKGGAAHEGGIQEKDVIVKVGAVEVNTTSELQELVSRFRPGDEINLTILRGGKSISKTVMLKSMEGKTELSSKEALVLGAQLALVAKEEQKSLKITHGVKIAKLTSGKLSREGIKEGFIILKINQKEVKSLEEVTQILTSHKGGILLEGIYPNGSKAYYGFGL